MEEHEMTNAEIVEKLYREGTVNKFQMNITKGKRFDWLEDLEHDLYEHLLTMDNDKLNGLYERKQLKFYIARYLTNNINSTTSPTYRHYRKFQTRSENISYLTDKEDQDDEVEE